MDVRELVTSQDETEQKGHHLNRDLALEIPDIDEVGAFARVELMPAITDVVPAPRWDTSRRAYVASGVPRKQGLAGSLLEHSWP